ncbi:MAG TPA: PaaI family thioesterase [Kiritimatiellia bacterium]|nr:PaaI family thioesterase [Kiritimatiellia bacterium]
MCGEDNPRGFRLKSRLVGDRVVIDYTPRETDRGYKHLVHGGVLMTLLDEVMTWAAILRTGKVCVAAELTARLKQPLAAGIPIHVEGWIERDARRILLAAGRVITHDQTLIVEASGKFMPTPNHIATLQAEDFVLPDSGSALKNQIQQHLANLAKAVNN